MQKAISEGAPLCIYAKKGQTFEDLPPVCGKVFRRVPTKSDIILTQDIIDNNPLTTSIEIASNYYPLNGNYFITHDDNNYIFTYDKNHEYNKFLERFKMNPKDQVVTVPKTEVLLMVPGYGKLKRNIVSAQSKYAKLWFSSDEKLKKFLTNYRITNRFLKKLSKPNSEKVKIDTSQDGKTKIYIMFKGTSGTVTNAHVFFIVENMSTIIGKLRIPVDTLSDDKKIPTNIEYLAPLESMFPKSTNWKQLQSGGTRKNMRTKRRTRRKYSDR
jgi:hypothetical protein